MSLTILVTDDVAPHPVLHQLAERLIETAAVTLRYRRPDHPNVGLTVGVAGFPDRTEPIARFIAERQRPTAALCRAKARGPRRGAVSSMREMDRQLTGRAAAIQYLIIQLAIDRGELSPALSAAGADLRRASPAFRGALLRWQHSNAAIFRQADFIAHRGRVGDTDHPDWRMGDS